MRVFPTVQIISYVHINLKLKLQQHEGKSKIVQSFAIEKFKDQNIADVFNFSNRFQALADVAEIQSTIDHLCTKKVIGRRRGRWKKEWIQDRSWVLVDLTKKAKKKWDQAQEAEDNKKASRAYADLDRAVKQSSRRDKKDWLEKKCKEAQVAADRNDTCTL